MTKVPERIGRYEVVSLIGKGGMGTVFHARDPILNRQVAVKLFHYQVVGQFEIGRARIAGRDMR